jgi:hypothetical protein
MSKSQIVDTDGNVFISNHATLSEAHEASSDPASKAPLLHFTIQPFAVLCTNHDSSNWRTTEGYSIWRKPSIGTNPHNTEL